VGFDESGRQNQRKS